MPIPASAFDERVEVIRIVPGAENALGERAPVPTKVCDAWASVSSRAAVERVGRAAVEAMTTEVFTLRWCEAHVAIAPKSHRILWGGRAYDVRAVSRVPHNEGVDVIGEAQADNGL